MTSSPALRAHLEQTLLRIRATGGGLTLSPELTACLLAELDRARSYEKAVMGLGGVLMDLPPHTALYLCLQDAGPSLQPELAVQNPERFGVTFHYGTAIPVGTPVAGLPVGPQVDSSRPYGWTIEGLRRLAERLRSHS